MAAAHAKYGALASEPGGQWRIGLAGFIEFAGARTASDLAGVLADVRPDLVVVEHSDIGATVAAGAEDIPTVVHGVSRMYPRELLEDPIAMAALDGLWRSVGVSDPPFDATVGERYLGVFPPSLEERWILDHPAYRPMRSVPWSEPIPLPPGLDRPLIYVTLGTVADSAAVLRAAVAGVARLDATVLVALGAVGDADLGPLGANVRVVPFVDQARLLPNVDLVVHHGGTGTFLGALAHGLPQLVLPQTADQPVNAQVAAAAGFGLGLAGDVDADSVEAAALRLLGDDAFRAAAARMRDEMSEMPDSSSVAAVLV